MKRLRIKKKKKNFTMISNECLQNPMMSNAARGLLVFMLSLPDNWRFSIAWLARNCHDGKDAISRQIAELEDKHYLVRTQGKQSRGRFGCCDYTISDVPMTDEEIEQIKSEGNTATLPSPDNQSTEDASPDNSPTINIIDINNNKTNNISINQEKSDFQLAYESMVETDDDLTDDNDDEDIPFSDEQIKDQIGYESLMRDNSAYAKQIDAVVDILSEAMSGKSRTVRIGKRNVSRGNVMDKLSCLTDKHIIHVLETFNSRFGRDAGNKPKKPKAYILTMLYNAVDDYAPEYEKAFSVPVKESENSCSSFDIEDLMSLANNFEMPYIVA